MPAAAASAVFATAPPAWAATAAAAAMTAASAAINAVVPAAAAPVVSVAPAPPAAAAALSALPAEAGLLVALGAIPGAWLRLQLAQHLAPRLGARHWATLAVNGSACLLLGVLVSLAPRSQAAPQLLLLLGTGFLGSFSTFSTFIAELSQLLQRRARRQAWALLVASLLLGLAATGLGLRIGSAAAAATP